MGEPIVSVVGVEDVQRLLDRLPSYWYKEARAVFKESVFKVHKKVSDRVRTGANNTLHSRTGALRRSLQPRIYGNDLKTLGGEVYTKLSYAPIQETGTGVLPGGVIKAKNAYRGVPGGPYLNIPLGDNKTPSGVQRRSAKSVFSTGGFIIKSRSGKYLVMDHNGVPMFVLVKSVSFPGRLKMRETAEKEIPTLLSNLGNATNAAVILADT